ncbi:MAG: helix-turn-helix transcriptional regulator [Deltaproteobacteria bacterium]|nr:helix-turn-helix transcriptional regulator [Deltaproteobacteria bacterium]MBW2138164.1 helix-turn-helix transcriptional regulator [Deltaproteobacteria bacterium]
MSKRGRACTHVREIVTCAGVTKPAWYYYFKNKRGVFYAILDSAIRVKCQHVF